MSLITREKSAELIFPFSLLRESSRKELCSPPEGWIVDDAFDVMLGCGEERIREYTIYFMKSVNTTTATLYDPACSTGVYLSTLKKAFPNSFTIGQDLSEQMVGFSRETCRWSSLWQRNGTKNKSRNSRLCLHPVSKLRGSDFSGSGRPDACLAAYSKDIWVLHSIWTYTGSAVICKLPCARWIQISAERGSCTWYVWNIPILYTAKGINCDVVGRRNKIFKV